MDSRQKWSCLFFDVEQVTRFLAKYRNRYGKHTKYVELEVALRFVSNLFRTQRKVYRIGFPTLSESDEPITLENIFERKMALDEDFDIVVAPKGEEQQTRHNLQIVRFTRDVEQTTEGVLDFLKEKKFRISKDENILLLVWLEKGLKLDYMELSQKFKEINVPYGQIFMVGETKRNESVIFFCLEVFPEVIRFKDLDVGFLKSPEHKESY